MILLGLIIILILGFTMVAVRTPIYNKLWVKIVICVSGILGLLLCIGGGMYATEKEDFMTEANSVLQDFNGCYVENGQVMDNYPCWLDYAHDVSKAISRFEAKE